jgi:uncharacterized protein DUF87
MDVQPKQRTRLLFMLFEVGILLLASFIAFHSWHPPLGEKGFWFYAALLSLLLGYRLTSPYYTSPKDALANAFPALVTLLLVNKWDTWSWEDRAAFTLAATFCAAITLCSIVAIFLKDSPHRLGVNVSNTLRILLEKLGNPRIVYGAVFAFSFYTFHRDSPSELLVIGGAGFLTIAISPFNFIYLIKEKISSQWQRKATSGVIAQSLAYQKPGIFLLREVAAFGTQRNDVILVKDSFLPPVITIALDHIGRDEGTVLRTIEVQDSLGNETVKALSTGLPLGYAAKIDAADIEDPALRDRVQNLTENMVGIVTTDSTINKLYFEITGDQSIEEGGLVEAPINGAPVIYQIINGYTKEDVVSQKNLFGFIRAEARKIGVWDADHNRFLNAPWLPTINAPVKIKQTGHYQVMPDCVGHFPRSSYGVRLASVDQLVTHNTAILGILGIGKTFLAAELLERMMAQGIKVICLDLTGQYAKMLAEYYCENKEREAIDAIRAACDEDRGAFDDNPDEGGSLNNLRAAIFEDLKTFLDPDNPALLKIYNPAELTATKQTESPRSYQEGGKWRRSAALWEITPVEVTRIISESALLLLQDRLSETARACLVYEEAHSLVPEWNNVSSDGDSIAVSGTARAILQGRKYGLGCLLITQRTANVTKTILNQCNTIFAMRTFDDTGKNFLANYIGSDYADILPSLQERHAIFFGRASSAENPVLIRVNDRDPFAAAFRAAHPLPNIEEICTWKKPETTNEAQPAPIPEETGVTEFQDDDVPW